MSSIKVNTSAPDEYRRLQKKSIFENIEEVALSNNSLTVLLLNVRSLLKHAMDIASDKRLMSNYILCFTERQIEQTQSDTDDLNLVFNDLNIYFNNNQNKFISRTYGFHDTITVAEKEDFPGISIVKFKKTSFSEEALDLMILYRGHSQTLTSSYEYLLYFIQANLLDIIIGDFNKDACNQLELSHLLTGYTQMVKSQTQIAGLILDHIYVKDYYFEDHIIKVSVLNTYFPDHDIVRCTISKN